MAQRPGWRHGAFHSLSWGLKGAYLCFWYPAQRRSPLPALPADHPAAESSLCISQAADATWGKCVKPVTPRALRKTKPVTRQKPSSACGSVYKCAECQSVSEHANLKISQAPGPQHKRLTRLHGIYYPLKRPQVWHSRDTKCFQEADGSLTSPRPSLHLRAGQTKAAGWLPRPGHRGTYRASIRHKSSPAPAHLI